MDAEKERTEREKPIRAQTKDRTGSIVWVSENMQLIEVYHKFEKGARMYWQAVVDGKLTNHCHFTPEAAFLFGLGYKFDEQGNTRFHHFAARMLPGFEAYENGIEQWQSTPQPKPLTAGLSNTQPTQT